MLDLTRRSFLVLGAATALSACATTMPLLPASSSAAPESLSREQIIAAINAVRAANGAPPWSYSPQLEAAARSQAGLCAARNVLSHNLGVTLRERVTKAGYAGAVGENLAGGHKTLDSAIQGWMNSPGHRSTLLSHKFTEFGLATARTAKGKTYWAMIAGGSFDAWRVYR
ncbi:CAP domain-containing protein [uncultured Devosia sp.]|uniref:CAP domain-containing protein n=1 Tax=uncultured Devosia sp. TaxID=211434 RepID=UPI0035CB65E8